MNEIKFRAWDSEIHYMHEWEQSEKPLKALSIPIIIASGWRLMQYTGLKDKNGKEIYFDDILEYQDEDGVSMGRVERTMCNGAGIIIDGVISDLWEDESVHTFQVAGNIYENPELLK